MPTQPEPKPEPAPVEQQPHNPNFVHNIDPVAADASKELSPVLPEQKSAEESSLKQRVREPGQSPDAAKPTLTGKLRKPPQAQKCPATSVRLPPIPDLLKAVLGDDADEYKGVYNCFRRDR